MQVEDKRFGEKMTFGDLSFGDCFIYDDEYYIKCDTVNAFNLKRNNVNVFLDGNKIVTPVNAKVVIE